MARKRPLWETHTIAEVIAALLEWGAGSGEELIDHLVRSGLTPQEARNILEVLDTSIASNR